MGLNSSTILLKPLVAVARLRAGLWRWLNAARSMDAERTQFYRRIWHEAADAIGAEIDELGDDIFEIRLFEKATRVQDNWTAVDDLPTLKLAGNKPLVLNLLADRGLPVPRWRQFVLPSLHQASAFLRQIGADCVVKPARDTGAGKGVTTHVHTLLQLLGAVAIAAVHGDELLIEEQIAGDNYRLLYLDGVLLDAVLRRPPTVTGDGRSTVRRLVQRANEGRLASGADAAQTLLHYDLDMRHTLAAQGLTIGSIPTVGRLVRLKTVINDNAACENVAAKALLCDAVIAAGARAAAAVGAKLAGVDIITIDPARPLDEVAGAIVEVNTTPGFYYHYHRQCEPRAVAVDILRYLLHPSRHGSGPAGSATFLEEHVDVGCL